MATLLQMLYQIKMLTWFIGRRQSPRSSRKIAPLFNGTGEIRMTRARAGIVKVSLQPRKKGCTMCTRVRMRCRLAWTCEMISDSLILFLMFFLLSAIASRERSQRTYGAFL